MRPICRWTQTFTRLAALLLLATPALSLAGPMGPTAMGGVVATLVQTQGDTRFSSLVGPTVRAGFEFGSRFNHELTFQLTHAGGDAFAGGMVAHANLTTYALGYRFGVDILKKEGFSPYVGVGVNLGLADVSASASSGGFTSSAAGRAPFLELNAALGARYTFDNGLGIRAEMAGSTYGGFFALQPSIGLAYTFGRPSKPAPPPEGH